MAYSSYGSGGGRGQGSYGGGRRQYSDLERKFWNIGYGSTFSQKEEGRKKQVKGLTSDEALIRSYKNGREAGLKQKKAYLAKNKVSKKGKF